MKVKSWLFFVVCGFALLIWWVKINFVNGSPNVENYLFGVAYALIALVGGLNGIRISKKWGWNKSYLGLGIMFLSLGLLGESFGQLTWAYFNLIKKVEIPYPSIADLGYFSIVPLYFISMLYFSRVCGVTISLKAFKKKIIALLIPMLMISISYYSFLRGQTLDFSNPIKTFLDLGYPLGEAIYVSLAIITLGLTTSVLGGSMKKKLLLVLIYFILQWLTDYSFLYSSGTGTYTNGGFVDLFYAISLVIGSIGITLFDRASLTKTLSESSE